MVLTCLAGPVWAEGAAPAWEGIWAAEADWCRFADKVGSHTPAPIALSRRSVDGYENSCAVTSVSQIGELRAWRLGLECQSEGASYDEDTLVMLESDDVLWRFWGTGAPVKFVRCSG